MVHLVCFIETELGLSLLLMLGIGLIIVFLLLLLLGGREGLRVLNLDDAWPCRAMET